MNIIAGTVARVLPPLQTPEFGLRMGGGGGGGGEGFSTGSFDIGSPFSPSANSFTTSEGNSAFGGVKFHVLIGNERPITKLN